MWTAKTPAVNDGLAPIVHNTSAPYGPLWLDLAEDNHPRDFHTAYFIFFWAACALCLLQRLRAATDAGHLMQGALLYFILAGNSTTNLSMLNASRLVVVVVV